MDVFIKKFDEEGQPVIKVADVDEEETIPVFKERVAAATGIDIERIRLMDDGDWGSLLLQNGTVEDISTNLVHLVTMPEDRTWDQFFFFVKPIGKKRQLVEADFLETVASLKSRLLLEMGDQRP